MLPFCLTSAKNNLIILTKIVVLNHPCIAIYFIVPTLEQMLACFLNIPCLTYELLEDFNYVADEKGRGGEGWMFY